jgi:endonuclease G
MAVWRGKNMSRIIQIVLILLLVGSSAYLFYQEKKQVHTTSASATTTSESALPTGWPVVEQHDASHVIQYLHNRCYDVGYSNERGNPLWVVYKLTDQKDGQVDKRQSKFITDTRTSAKIVHEHYSRSGYDRGHLAPNNAIAVMCDDEAQKETFLLSNITPQSKALNERWWERLERAELTYFTHIFKEIWVIDGPIFGAHPVLLPNGPVQVPEACYKVYIARKGDQWHTLAFMVDQGVNGDETFSQYRTSIQNIEKRIGLDLLPNLPDELKHKLKQDDSDKMWNLMDVDKLPARF